MFVWFYLFAVGFVARFDALVSVGVLGGLSYWLLLVWLLCLL